MDAFYLNQSISWLGLEAVPIGTWEVPIGTCHVPTGSPRVLIGPLKCWAQFPILVQFGLSFRDFLSRELHLQTMNIWSCDIFQSDGPICESGIPSQPLESQDYFYGMQW